MKTRLLAVILSLSLCCGTLFAAGEPGSFLSWGAGARAMGMGNAAVGVVNDAYAIYWNPAVLGKLDQKEIATFHAMLWEDTSLSFLSYVHPMPDQSGFGFSFTRLYSGGAERRNEFNQPDGTFADQQMALAAGYGVGVGKDIYWGMSGKFVNVSLDSYSRDSLTFDTGLFMNATDRLSLGLDAQNIIAGTFGDTEDKLPLVVRLGSGYQILNKGRLLMAADIARKFTAGKSSYLYSLGVESRINRIISLRLGRNQDETTAGMGFTFDPLRFDYALALHYLGASHRISFNYRFGSTIGDMRKDLDAMLSEPIPEPAPPKEETPEELARKAKIQEKFQEIYRAALDLYKKGMYNQALDKFVAAQEVDPNDPDVPIYIERLNLIVPIVPQAAGTGKTIELVRRGIGYFIDGNGESSVKTIAYALSTEPDNFTISRLLTRVEEKTGVKAEYTKPVSGMSIVDQKLYETLIAFRKKDYARVIDLCEEVLVLEPRNVLAYKRLGSAFFALGDKERAVRSWKKALQIAPDPTLKRLIDETGVK